MMCFLNWRKKSREHLENRSQSTGSTKRRYGQKCVFSLNAPLQRYKYPPDKQEEAVTYVIKQAEEIAEDFN